MYYLNLPFHIQPKPRGIQGKHGNIYHNSKPYKLFKQRMRDSIKSQIDRPKEVLSKEVFVGFLYVYHDFGQNPDLDNLEGAIMDSLKLNKIIKDDNRRIWIGSYKLAIPHTKFDSHFWIGSLMERFRITKAVEDKFSEHFMMRSNLG